MFISLGCVVPSEACDNCNISTNFEQQNVSIFTMMVMVQLVQEQTPGFPRVWSVKKQ